MAHENTTLDNENISARFKTLELEVTELGVKLATLNQLPQCEAQNCVVGKLTKSDFKNLNQYLKKIEEEEKEKTLPRQWLVGYGAARLFESQSRPRWVS